MAETRHASEYCSAELMAAFLSRDLKDDELGVCGAFSLIPWSA